MTWPPRPGETDDEAQTRHEAWQRLVSEPIPEDLAAQAELERYLEWLA